MEKNLVCKNAGFISEDELIELVDSPDVNGGTVEAVTATIVAATAISSLFTVTSACTTKC